MALFGPLWVFYHNSRRFEYSADQQAVGFTGDRETAAKALVDLHEARELPAVSAGLARIFMTHPMLARRVRAVRYGH